MKEIEFKINQDTGEMEIEINGMRGKGCDEIAAKIAELLGQPAKQENKPEYYAQTLTNNRITVKR